MDFNVTRRAAVSRQGFIAVIHNDEILIVDAKLVPQLQSAPVNLEKV